MKEYSVKYKLKGIGELVFMANSKEEAEEEFYRIMCGDEPQIKDNTWIDQGVIFDLEWDNDILDTREE